MNSDNRTQQEWPACPPGEVSRMSNRLQGHRRAVAGQRKMIAGLLVLLLAVSGYYFVGVLPHAKPNFGGIVCSEVHNMMPQYLAKRLDAAASARIDEHLQHCKKCRGAMESMAPGSIPVSGSTHVPTAGGVASQTAEHEEFLRVAIEGFAAMDR